MHWVALVSGRIDGERPELREDGIEADFTPESLRAVERALAEWYPRIDWGSADHVRHYEAIAAYVGEVLLRRGGGRWREDEGERVPPIEADPALGLPPLDLDRLIADAGGAEINRAETGADHAAPGVLRRAYDAWDRAVAAHEAEHPGWVPAKEPTPGLDPVPLQAGEATVLDDWLAAQREAFPAWAARYGGGAEWDRSAASLEELAEVALREMPTVEALEDPANAAFTEPACWYAGETLLQAAPGRWATQISDSPFHLYAGKFYVTADGPEGLTIVPRELLAAVVGQRDAASVRSWYDAFRAPPEMY